MEKCAEQQRLLFLGMCSLEDRKRICDEKIMDLYNFERICIFRKNCASVPEERSAIPLQTEQSSAG